MTHVPLHLAAKAVGISNDRLKGLILAKVIKADKVPVNGSQARYNVNVKSLLAWTRPDKRERVKERLGLANGK